MLQMFSGTGPGSNGGAGRTLWAVALILLGSPLMLQAYIDPGSGSMLLQVLVGGLLALAAGLRFYWRKVASFFRGSKGDRPNES